MRRRTHTIKIGPSFTLMLSGSKLICVPILGNCCRTSDLKSSKRYSRSANQMLAFAAPCNRLLPRLLLSSVTNAYRQLSLTLNWWNHQQWISARFSFYLRLTSFFIFFYPRLSTQILDRKEICTDISLPCNCVIYWSPFDTWLWCLLLFIIVTSNVIILIGPWSTFIVSLTSSRSSYFSYFCAWCRSTGCTPSAILQTHSRHPRRTLQ